MAKITIKSENQKQKLLFPPCLDKLISEAHVVSYKQFMTESIFENGECITLLWNNVLIVSIFITIFAIY